MKTARERRRYWIRETNKRRRIINAFADRFYRALQYDAKGFLTAYQTGGQTYASNYINSLMVSERIKDTMDAMYREVGARYAKQTYDGLQVKAATLEEWFNQILQYIGNEFYSKGVLRITQTTRKFLQAILDKSITEGWGYEETARYFNDVMPSINRNRAEMIARTEGGKAIHAGTYVGANASPWEKEKIWIGARKPTTRGNPIDGQSDKADHWNLDGATVPFDSYFVDPRSGAQLLHPHDPKAGAADVINCLCTFSVQNKLDENGNLIRRVSRVTVIQPGNFVNRRRVVTV